MAKKRRSDGRERTFEFSLILTGAGELTDELEGTLLRAGCDDALLGAREGVVFLSFEREAESFAEAILGAIADVQKAKADLWVSRVEPDDLVSASEMARRLHRTRESIRQLAQGERGPGTFPPPVANLTQRSPIWRWAEVAEWFASNYEEYDDSLHEDASFVAAVNAALELRRHVRSRKAVDEIWRRIQAPRR